MITKTNPEEFESYLSDASNYKGHCTGVVFPATTAEVSAVLIDANRTAAMVTIAGNGTGLTGGRCPEGGILLSMERMNHILEIDTEHGCVITEAGVTLLGLQDALTEMHYFFPPDPTEQLCYIGGTIATNASGAKSFSYGPVRNFVLGLEVVLPSGEILWIERGQYFASGYRLKLPGTEMDEILLPKYEMPGVKNAAGYYIRENMDAVELFIGSEGTLGVITKAKLRILPLPEKTISCVAFFTEESTALHFIDITRERAKNNNVLSARALEFFDSRSLNFLRPTYNRIPALAQAAVWFEQECSGADEELLLDRWLELLNISGVTGEHIWYAADAGDLQEIREFRHAISYKVNEFITARGFKKLGTDTAVPVQYFGEFLTCIKSMVEQAGIAYVAYGHYGDCHVHLNMLPENEQQFVQAKNLYREICALSVSYGGTVSAEHGIGKAKREYLEMMYGKDAVNQMKNLKLQFDPNNLLNVGNLFL
ncbi:MAG: FAD-binding oxidoreductase [Ignavibacteriales bacterium]|nr:FAD-binding oxidoreductase [Ignavibacteriales bacterium]